jgi:hypothetical protein
MQQSHGTIEILFDRFGARGGEMDRSHFLLAELMVMPLITERGKESKTDHDEQAEGSHVPPENTNVFWGPEEVELF